MIQLQKLYSNPEIFKPIKFENGLNIIMGEKVDEKTSENRKTNGVGKSLCIEFIDFCLLKKDSESRVMKIASHVFEAGTQIILDLIIHGEKVTIVRSKANPKEPIIFNGSQKTVFTKLEDATQYLSYLLFGQEKYKISFRTAISLLIRDEKSEFRDIMMPHDLKRRIPPNYEVHNYLFDIDLELCKNIEDVIKDLASTSDVLKELNKEFKRYGYDKQTLKSELNDLKSELETIKLSVEQLESSQAFESIQKDLVEFEDSLDELRIRQKAIRYELKKIESLPEPEKITETDIEMVYNQFKQGLGDMVTKSLAEVQSFKAKIDDFQSILLDERAKTLKSELNNLAKNIRYYDKLQQEKIGLLDENGRLRSLKVSIATLNQKDKEYERKNALYNNWEAYNEKKSELKIQKDELIDKDLRKELLRLSTIVNNFEQTILQIHHSIMGNRKASFEISTVNKSTGKKYIDFVLRIDSDGSHSVDRTKVFIYDIALLFNQHTGEKHPKFLIHDNIFDVDKDTLVQSLNFLYKSQEKYTDFQYILTLNRDEIEAEETQQKLNFDINTVRRVVFTKKNKFLSSDYQEQ